MLRTAHEGNWEVDTNPVSMRTAPASMRKASAERSNFIILQSRRCAERTVALAAPGYRLGLGDSL
jgi:hypothetical protein